MITYKQFYIEQFKKARLDIPVLTAREAALLSVAMESDIARTEGLNVLQVAHPHTLERIFSETNIDQFRLYMGGASSKVTLATVQGELLPGISQQFSPTASEGGNPHWVKSFISLFNIHKNELKIGEPGTSEDIQNLLINKIIEEYGEQFIQEEDDYDVHLQVWGQDPYAGSVEIIIPANLRNRVCGTLLEQILVDPNQNVATLLSMPLSTENYDLAQLMINHYADALEALADRMIQQEVATYSATEADFDNLFSSAP